LTWNHGLSTSAGLAGIMAYFRLGQKSGLYIYKVWFIIFDLQFIYLFNVKAEGSEGHLHCVHKTNATLYNIILLCFTTVGYICIYSKAVTALATFSTRIVVYAPG